MTKTPYISLLALLAAGGAASVSAQTAATATDSTLVREMTIEKEYTPTVRDAEKISRMPAVETPVANKTRIEYAEPTLASKAGRELTTLGVGSVNTAYPFSNQRGYLMLEGGNLLTFKGDFGVNILDTERHRLGFDMHHYSTNGRIDFVDADGDTRRRINDNSIRLHYRHRRDNLELTNTFGFGYSYFNFYGSYMGDDVLNTTDWTLTDGGNAFDPSDWLLTGPAAKQTIKRFTHRFDISSRGQSEWDYKFGFGYNTLKQTAIDLTEHDINLTLGLGKKLDDEWRLDGDIDIDALIYGGEQTGREAWQQKGDYDKVGRARIAPAFRYKRDDALSACLGVNFDMAFGIGPHVGIAPNIDFRWKATDYFALYGSVKGGIEQYSLGRLTQEYRYYASPTQNKNSYTVADLRFGFQTNPAAGLMIDLSAGGGYTVDELLLETLLETVDAPSADGLTPGHAVRNILAGYTADVASMDVTAKLKYKWSDVFDFGLDVVYRHHNVKDDGIASYLPGWEIKPSITLRPVKPLSVDVSYGIKGDREAQVRRIDLGSTTATDGQSELSGQGSPENLDDLQQLDAKVAYRFCDAFVLNASLNNLLFRKQSVWYGMPEPGFTFLVGGTLKF